MPSLNPILNNPYTEPKQHYAIDGDGSLNYDDKRDGRRIFTPDIQVMPMRQGSQKNAFDINDFSEQFENHLINLCRKEVARWRNAQYPNTTRVTRELLHFWFLNPERHAVKKLFFAQQEAVETAVWLNEVAGQSNAGQNILNMLSDAQKSVGNASEDQLPRIAFKMATGSGKTVVIACLILYHYFNRQEYRNDTRFADYFLIVAPGISIKDRLGVLNVDKWKRGISDLAKQNTKRKAEKTLKIEIDEEAFDQLYGHISHPIQVKSKDQKIAVRIISQFGEESTKVLGVS